MSEFYKSYSKEIYDKIKLDILKLNIRDGDFLTLSELANKYKVSKTPIRDALGALEIEGYLLSLPRKGYLVKPVTQRSIRECFQMRLILEKAAVGIAIGVADSRELDDILKLASTFPEDINDRQAVGFNELNNSFHMKILHSTHNSLLVESFEDIMENLSRILRLDSNNVELSNQKEEHIGIAEALVKRDRIEAEKLVTQHILNLETRVCNNNMGGWQI